MLSLISFKSMCLLIKHILLLAIVLHTERLEVGEDKVALRSSL